MAQRVLIGGGSGFVGSALLKHLTSNGYAVTLISRTKGPNRITWKEVEEKGIPDVDVVVQLAGAGILDKRWTQTRKEELWNSRVMTTASLTKAIEQSKSPPKVYVGGSAVGIYPSAVGDTPVYKEDSPQRDRSLPSLLVNAWESTYPLPPALQDVTRSVIIRSGVVLGKDGGLFKKMSLPFRFGLGGQLGSGTQYMPWIHIDDLVALYMHCITHSDVNGVLNAVAPQFVTNSEFTAALAKALHRPAIIPMPEFVVKMLFGESAIMLLEGQKVVPERTLQTGFQFKYPTVDKALAQIVK